ncbi:MAG: MotA/TolQ/ExbB proton channel family protein [Simkaniaceae bacterium]
MTIAAISAFSSAYAQSDFFGKGIFWGLFLLSAITWFLILYKFYVLRQVKKLSANFQKIIDQKKNSVLEISLDQISIPPKSISIPFIDLYLSIKKKTIELLDKNHFFLSKQESAEPSRVYLSHIDMEFMESYAQTLIESKKEKLEKDLFILSTISTLAPFLGLLGTVWGILVTFTGLGSGGSLSSNSAILSGLSTALTTTVLGLLIAIPSLIAYNYFRNVIKTYYSDMQDFGSHLLSTIELQYRKVDLGP